MIWLFLAHFVFLTQVEKIKADGFLWRSDLPNVSVTGRCKFNRVPPAKDPKQATERIACLNQLMLNRTIKVDTLQSDIEACEAFILFSNREESVNNFLLGGGCGGAKKGGEANGVR